MVTFGAAARTGSRRIDYVPPRADYVERPMRCRAAGVHDATGDHEVAPRSRAPFTETAAMHSHTRHAVRAAMLATALLAARDLAAQAPADSTSADSATVAGGRRLFPIPALFYTPETKVGGGVALTAVTRRAGAPASDRPSAASGVLLYTQRAQVMASAGVEHWTPGNRWQLMAGAGFQRFPTTFYGIGSAVPDTGEDYTPRTVRLEAGAMRRVRGALYFGGNAGWEQTTILETAAGGTLGTGTLRGSRGGTVSSAGLRAAWDSRDNLWYAARGAYVELAGLASDAAIGSDFDFRRVSLDARAYRALGAGTRTRAPRVVAVQAVVASTGGDVPFDRLAQIGGQRLVRGYFEGRFRDRAAAALQGELRTPIWRRLGAAAFFGAGEVAEGLGDFRVSEIRTAGGFGLRFALSHAERINIRIDQGIGQGGSSGTYITIGEAF